MMQGANTQFIKTLCILIILFLFTANGLWAKISIMPLGDSITLGLGPTDLPEDLNGYRRGLWDLLTSSGYDVDFVGSLSNGTFVEKQHEGHTGWRDDQIADGIYTFLNNNPANIILLHIGTNGLAESETDVEKILDEINRYEDEKDVKIHVIIARIINRSCITDIPPCAESVTTTKFNNNVANMIQSRIDSGDNLLHIVDMEVDAGLNYQLATDDPPGDMADNLHPSYSGYAKMADKWFVDGLLAILPIADAGSDQFVNEKTLVTLNGSGSGDPNGSSLNYFWEQQAMGTLVVLSDPKAEKPTFTAPETGSSGETLTFDLTVTDADGFQNIDTISVHISNVLIAPEVDAGPDQIVQEGNTVTLNGSNSYDPDGTISSVQWEQLSGNTQVHITTPTDLTTDFTAPEVDTEETVLEFKLTIKDNENLVGEDIVNVTVTPVVVSTASSSGGGSGGGGCFIQSVSN